MTDGAYHISHCEKGDLGAVLTLTVPIKMERTCLKSTALRFTMLMAHMSLWCLLGGVLWSEKVNLSKGPPLKVTGCLDVDQDLKRLL